MAQFCSLLPVVLIAFAVNVDAFPNFQKAIPNGNIVKVNGEAWRAVGHKDKDGDGPRNPFGDAFEAAGYKWTKELCEADSDGNGQSNGHELGDPTCEWTPGASALRTTDVSNPGITSSMTSAAKDEVDSGEVVYKGFLVDLYCFGLVKAGGRALDGTNVLTAPETHTLHCLRDPSQCRNGGYYVAGKNEATGDYDVQFRFDDQGNQAALALLDSTGTDDYPGFTVTVTGVATADGRLTEVQMEQCLPNGSPECDSKCTGAGCSLGGGDQDFDLSLPSPALLWLHVICMISSWGFLLPLGVLWARNLKQSSKTPCGTPIWFQGHWILQSVGWLLQLVGFIAIFFHKGGFEHGDAHFGKDHEKMGLTVVIIGTLQPLNAQIRHLSFIGHGKPPKSVYRYAWEFLHKGLGYVAVLLGIVTIILGIKYANDIGFSGGLVPFAIVCAAVFLGSQIAFAPIGEVLRCRRKSTEVEKV